MRLLLLTAAVASAPLAPADKPDLQPGFDPKTGVVTIKNESTRAVDVSTYVTVTCQRVTPPIAQGTGCPPVPNSFRRDYVSRRAPGAAIFSLGYLAPGAVVRHRLAYWPRLHWTAGDYRIDVNVDVGNKVFETDEQNNLRTFSARFPE